MAMVAMGLLALGGIARAQGPLPSAPGASPTPTTAPAPAEPPRPPETVRAEASTPQSAELTSRAATAAMNGNPQESLRLADEAIRADPKDPWAHYNKGMALGRMGELNGALAALFAAQQHFAPYDRWGQSVAAFGRAHLLAEAGQCPDARVAFQEYMNLARGDQEGIALAQRLSRDCRAPSPGPATATPPAATTPPATK
ncbi:MAG TPA: tetratricopeptide repeat protein [Polyangia bacterium]|nr:tetratricopeptide repeat protein [Polyangia bacterium]